MSELWDEFHRRVGVWQQSGDAERLALTSLFHHGAQCQENDPEGSFTLFTRGRDEAIRLNEPWWALFFEDWRLIAITSYVMDFSRAQPLAMELMVRLNSEQGLAADRRNSILTSVLYTYINVDPIGYREEIERGFQHLDGQIPTEPVSDRCVLNHRWNSYLSASERWVAAYDLAIRALALIQEAREPSTRIWHGAWALNVLCRICDQLGKTDELAGHAEDMADLSSKHQQLRRTQADACMWQAGLQRANGDNKSASRSFHRGLGLLGGVERRSSACADSMARYHEVGGELQSAIAVRDRELMEVSKKGMLHRVCQVHLERCRLRALAGDLTSVDLDAARLAVTRLRTPASFPAKLERIVASPRDESSL